MIYTIPEYNVKKVVKKLDALNKRVEGQTTSLISYTVSAPYEKIFKIAQKDGEYKDFRITVVDIDLTNSFVALNGWSFLAVIEHTKEGNIVLKKLYDVEIPEKYKTSTTFCEHCKTNRYRKNTYLVYNKETDTIYQVGSTCINAYLGFDASLLVSHATFIEKLSGMMDSEMERGRLLPRGEFIDPLDFFMKKVIAFILTGGYVSAKMARERSTEERPLSPTGIMAFSSDWDKYNKHIVDLVESSDVSDILTKVYEWVDGLEKKSDYIHNLKVIKANGYVTYRTATTAASMAGVYFMEQERAKKAKKTTVSNHVGNIKERLDFDMVLDTKRAFESQYGTGVCFSFTTKEGNTVVWFTNSVDLEVGTRYVGKATVVKHTEFKGHKQTIVNRCKLTEAE